MIEFTNLAEFNAALRAYVEETRQDWDRIYRAWCSSVFATIVKESPQWSGNFAANWNFATGSESTSYLEFNYLDAQWRDQNPIRWKGDPAAVEEAMSRSAGERAALTVHKGAYINNLTPYAPEFTMNTERLRPSNFINPTPIPIGHAVMVADGLFAEVTR